MLAPALLVLGAVLFIPMVFSLWTSVQADGTAANQVHLVGGANYRTILHSSAFWHALWVSAIFTAGSVIGSYVFGLAVALLVFYRAPGSRLLQGIAVIPWALPYVAAAILWSAIFDYQYGIANYVLKELGISSTPVGWLTSPHYALTAVVAVQVWKLFPLTSVMLLAGLQAIPKERLEAAAVDGATGPKIVRHVVLPGLRPVSAILTLLLTIWVFGRSFTVIYVLTGGGPVNATQNLVIQIFQTGFQLFHLQEAAALGTLVFVISAILTVGYWRFAWKRVDE